MMHIHAESTYRVVSKDGTYFMVMHDPNNGKDNVSTMVFHPDSSITLRDPQVATGGDLEATIDAMLRAA